MPNVRRQRIHSIAAAALFVVALFGMFFVAQDSVHAQTEIAGNLATVNAEVGLGTTDIRIVIARVIRIALSFLGIIAVSLMIYAGFIWMTSNGDPTKLKKAQGIMINAAVGLVIILSSLAITQFILSRLLEATGAGGSGTASSAAGIITPLSSALGAGIIDTHYPARNQTGIPRNTNIAVTFRREMNPTTIMPEYDAVNPSALSSLNTDAVRIYYVDVDDLDGDGDTDEEVELLAEEVDVGVTVDNKTFVFNPNVYLGSAETPVWYSVELTNDIELADSTESIFRSGGYTWTFQVSTELDLVPPIVKSVIPLPNTTNARNILVQINYSEAINPISAVGQAPTPFTNITLLTVPVGSGPPAGNWMLGNAYRTSEFIADTVCGVNSCGESITCLPANILANVEAKAAARIDTDTFEAAFPYSGLVDMAGNRLDGNDNEVPDETDSYTWSFQTNNEIVLVEPHVTTLTPPLDGNTPASNIPFDQAVRLRFDSALQVSTVNADNVILHSPTEALWFTNTVNLIAGTPPVHEVTIQHGSFSEDLLYGAEVDSGLRSVYQNCFTPSRSQACIGPNCCNEASSSSVCTYPTL